MTDCKSCLLKLKLLPLRYLLDLSDVLFLNQSRAWFIEIDPVRERLYMCVCVCPPPRLLITSGVICRDMDLIRLVKQVLSLLYGNCSRYR